MKNFYIVFISAYFISGMLGNISLSLPSFVGFFFGCMVLLSSATLIVVGVIHIFAICGNYAAKENIRSIEESFNSEKKFPGI